MIRIKAVTKAEFVMQTKEGFENFSYGSGADFENLLQFVDQSVSLNGDFVEIGCFQVLHLYFSSLYVRKKIKAKIVCV